MSALSAFAWVGFLMSIAVSCGLVQCLKKQIEQHAVEIERLRQSVLDEREACAKIADVYALGVGSERNYSELIADGIRAR